MANLNPKMLAFEAASILNISVPNLHKRLKKINVPIQKIQNRIYFSHNVTKELFSFKFKPLIYSTALVKGGVGKTTIALNFAIRCSLLGAKVALIEIDQQANLTRSCGVNAKNVPVMIDILNENISLEDSLIPIIDGLDLLPSRVDNALIDNTLLLRKMPLDKIFFKPLSKLKKKYDVIIVDCPPSIGPSVSAAALASDIIIMPINPTDYSIAGLDLTYRELKDLCSNFDKKLKLKIIFNKYDGRTSLSYDVLSDMIKHPIYGKMMVSSYIKNSQSIENAVSSGKSIFDNAKNSNEKDDFSVITYELLGIEDQVPMLRVKKEEQHA